MHLRRRFIVSIIGQANKIDECYMSNTFREIITNAPLLLLPILFSIKMPTFFIWLTTGLLVATLLVSGIIYYRAYHSGTLVKYVKSVTIVDIVFWAVGGVIWLFGKQTACAVAWGIIVIVLAWIFLKSRRGKFE